MLWLFWGWWEIRGLLCTYCPTILTRVYEAVRVTIPSRRLNALRYNRRSSINDSGCSSDTLRYLLAQVA